MQGIKVENMQSPRGNDVPNQFIIYTQDGIYFQSYSTIIAFKPQKGKIVLDPKWDYSKTTGQYRNIFLRESKAETQRKINQGIYLVQNLNRD